MAINISDTQKIDISTANTGLYDSIINWISGSPNIVLKNNPYAAPSLRFPLDLGSIGEEPYIIFSIWDPVMKKGKCKGSIALNMPPIIKTSYSQNYKEISNPLKMFASLLGDAGAGDLWKSIQAAGKNNDYAFGGVLSALKKLGGVAGDAAMRGTAQAAEAALSPFHLGNIGDMPNMIMNSIINPHSTVIYEGTDLRAFSFTFNMMARNHGESNAIRDIIKTFKYYSAPGAREGDAAERYLEYPHNFRIRILSPADGYLFKISNSVLESMDVDYGAENTPVFFKKSGAPVNVNMTLNFKELEIITKERVLQGY